MTFLQMLRREGLARDAAIAARDAERAIAELARYLDALAAAEAAAAEAAADTEAAPHE
jgi:hypothetical protein